MPTVDDVCQFLQNFAPLELAEDWDNVGLLVGDRCAQVNQIMTCLTMTPASVAEAVRDHADLVVVHHPLPFRPLSQLTSDTNTGRMLLDLIAANVAVYSPHTAFDSAAAGINQYLAQGLELQQMAPLVPTEQVADADVGAGRCGMCLPATTLGAVVERVKSFLKLPAVRVVGDDDRPVRRVAVACGSGGALLEAAARQDCDCFVTGETSFHTCLEAEAQKISLVLTGHFASERFAVEMLAVELESIFSPVQVWASRDECDPLRSA